MAAVFKGISMIQDETRNLFLDNIVDNISAKDMRDFVDNIWQDKEKNIQKIDRLADFDETDIEKDDLVFVTGGDLDEQGIYINPILNPTFTDLVKITSQISEIPSGDNDQILSIVDDNLKWVDRWYTFRVLGTLPIDQILVLRPKPGSTYIAEDTSITATIPGTEGDGYNFDGTFWSNIGQMRGPEGVIHFSTQQETLDGVFTDKAVSPDTLKKYVNDRLKINLGGVLPTHNDLVGLMGAFLNWQGKQKSFILQDTTSWDAVPLKTYRINYIPQGSGLPGSAGLVDKFYIQDLTPGIAL